MAELGYLALFLALVASLYALLGYLSGARGRPGLLHRARASLMASFILLSLSIFVLALALLFHDFSIDYVARYSSTATPAPYLLSALWAGNKGSLLFWAWLLAVFSAIMVRKRDSAGEGLLPHAAAVMMFCQLFFLVLLVSLYNPFTRLPVMPAEGSGLNPMLENPGMVIHPPLLLAGYVALTVPFALAVAALAGGRLDNRWLLPVRKWALVAWLFLGAGNIIGAWWAYVELGWGGYWAWDPVENAGLIPWLLTTAFLHSVIMQRRRGIFRGWNMVLIILAFNLAVFGTFLTRSGVLASVHTFGASPVGPLFIGLLIFLILGSLALLWYRLPQLQSDHELDSMISRESSFLLNNLLLVGAAFAVFWGTVFPLISEAVRGVKVTVNAPFFNQVEGPILLALVLLMGVCPLIGWRRASTENLIRNFAYPLAVAAISAPILYFGFGVRVIYAAIAFAACAFVLATLVLEFCRGTRAKHRLTGRNYPACLASLIWGNKPRYGGYIIHLGVILMAIGVAGSQAYKVEQEVTLDKGQDTTVGAFRLVYEGLNTFPTQRKEVVSATIAVYSGDRLLGRMSPSKEFHNTHDTPNTEVTIRSTLLEDLYLILNSWEGERANFKFIVNPLVIWIWIGGWVVLLGAGIAYWPDARERRRAAALEAQRAARVGALAAAEG